MVFHDWHNPEEYAFTHNLSSAQWAWEFLRRNSDYQEEWAAFNEVWQALEAAPCSARRGLSKSAVFTTMIAGGWSLKSWPVRPDLDRHAGYEA